ncbi:MAG: alpha/beta hydrolase [Planctomycetes bacterium]|nr:alpha/beta hydrolase [Planctomycetota bacterium]
MVKASRTAIRAVSLPLSLRQVFELERFPSVPYRIVESEPRLKEDPEIVAQHEAAVAALHEELEERLAQTDRKEVVIFIHGFNVNFEHAVFTSAELWHFMGRQGVPICYSWPAGRGLSGRGYTYDTVSSEFTVFHLKQTLRAVARCKAVEKVHILAHSRGTAVATTALCELMAEHRHFKDSARSALKLGNVILTAPDLDYEVTQQKLGGEHVMHLPERMTVYTHPGDKALAAADILTLGMARLGNLAPMDMTENLREMLQSAPLSMIEARVSAGFIGHSYFIDSPAVSSDLILVLRDNLNAGKKSGRPLIERMKNFWQIRDDYLKKR